MMASELSGCGSLMNERRENAKGGILAASLLRERLVDEIGVAIQPILLGSGIPLFPDIGLQVDLQLLECKTYKNGIVGLKYRVKI